jgi:anaerobic selenocysteine-containing dehydrogenase
VAATNRESPSTFRAASACPLDCPDACSLEVSVEEGRVVSIGGSRVNPLTEGYICAKVRRFPEHLYGPDRVRVPQIRIGKKGDARFRRATWNEALDLVAGRMRQLASRGQGDRILPFSYGGSNGYLSQDTTDARLFSRLGASRLARTVCAAPSGAAADGLYGKMPGVAFQDYVHARLIVLWGVNPSVSGIHLVPHVLEARRRGAKLVVIDPRRTRLAAQADVHLPVRPGSDLAVALALHRWIFENGAADETFLAEHATGVEEFRRRAAPWTFARAAEVSGVSAGDLERFARLYAETEPAVVRCGWGLERNRNGGSAVAAVLALPAVAGKFGVRGGGYTMSNSKAFDLDALTAARADAWTTREVNMNRLGSALLGEDGGRVELLFVYNSNPAATIPDQGKVLRGLSREDLFTVVFDPVLTDTARYADVVLPAATFLEREELSRGYGALVLQRARPAAEPVGESRPNHEVFADLCRRVGVARDEDPETAEELTRSILDASREGKAIEARLSQGAAAFPGGNPALVQFVDVFPRTPGAKVRLVPEALDAEAPEGLYGFRPDPATAAFPLALISPATDRTISSTLGDLHRGPVPVEMHPLDARRRGISDGDAVRVFNERGEVLCRARSNATLSVGVVLLPKGLWRHATENHATATALAPDSLTDIGGGACFNDARVEVERRGV